MSFLPFCGGPHATRFVYVSGEKAGSWEKKVLPGLWGDFRLSRMTFQAEIEKIFRHHGGMKDISLYQQMENICLILAEEFLTPVRSVKTAKDREASIRLIRRHTRTQGTQPLKNDPRALKILKAARKKKSPKKA